MVPAMIEITDRPIVPGTVINRAKTDNSGCVATYVGVIRNHSGGKPVLWVEYRDTAGTAESGLRQIASEVRQRWPVINVAIYHRTGRLKPGDINLVIAIAAAHRQEGFAACQYVVDRFKQMMPTGKTETYRDGSTQTDRE